MNQVTYVVDMTPENADKIDQINRILLGDDYSKAPTSKPEPKAKTPAKETKTTKDDTVGDLAAVKAAVKAAKAEHGEDFVYEVLEAAGAKKQSTLLKTVSAVDGSKHDALIAALEEGPTKAASDEPEDEDLEDDLEDDLDEEEEADIDVDAVKTAVRAYNKEHGRDDTKALMAKHGAKALSDIDKLSAAKLTALFKAVS